MSERHEPPKELCDHAVMVRLPKTLHAELGELARRAERTRGAVGRTAIREYVERSQRKARQK